MPKAKNTRGMESTLLMKGVILFVVGILIGAIGVGISLTRSLDTDDSMGSVSAPKASSSGSKSTQKTPSGPTSGYISGADPATPANSDKLFNQLANMRIIQNLLIQSGDVKTANVVDAWADYFEDVGTNGNGPWTPGGFDLNHSVADFEQWVDDVTEPPLKARIITLLHTNIADARAALLDAVEKALLEIQDKAQNAEAPGVVTEKVSAAVDKLLESVTDGDVQAHVDEIKAIIATHPIKEAAKDKILAAVERIRTWHQNRVPGAILKDIASAIKEIEIDHPDLAAMLKAKAEQIASNIDVRATLSEIDLSDVIQALKDANVKEDVSAHIIALFAQLQSAVSNYDPLAIVNNIQDLISTRPQLSPEQIEQIWNAIVKVKFTVTSTTSDIKAAIAQVQAVIDASEYPEQVKATIMLYTQKLVNAIKLYPYGQNIQKIRAVTSAIRETVRTNIIDAVTMIKNNDEVRQDRRDAAVEAAWNVVAVAKDGADAVKTAVANLRKVLSDAGYPDKAIDRIVTAAQTAAAAAVNWVQGEKQIVVFAQMLVDAIKAVDLKSAITDAKNTINDIASAVTAQIDDVKRNCTDTDPKLGDFAGDPTKYGWLEYQRFAGNQSKVQSADYCSGKSLFQATCDGYDPGLKCTNSCMTKDVNGKITAVCQ